MKVKDIQINEVYRIKGNPYFFSPREVLNPKEKENRNSFTVVKGVFSTTKYDFGFGLIKYFKPSDILQLKKKR